MARESKESIRERILAAAERRFWHYGIKKTTIDEIAADADVGKGTVYLHFESKEEIALAIISQYKLASLGEQQAIAADKSAPLLDRLKRVLALPIERTAEHCRNSPMVMEMVSAVRPQFPERMRQMLDEEIGLIATLLNEGNATGEMHVKDTWTAARLIKSMTLSYMPTIYPAAATDAGDEIQLIVELLYHGLK